MSSMFTTLVFSLLLAAKTPDPSLVHTPPTQVRLTDGLELTGKLSDGSDIERLELKFRQNDGAWRTQEFDPQPNGVYTLRIAAPTLVGGGFDYYVIAFDFLGRSKEVYASAKKPERLKVIAGGAATGSEDTPIKPDPRVTDPVPSGPKEPKDVVPISADTASAPAAPELHSAADNATQAHTYFDRAAIVRSRALTLAEILLLVPELFVYREVDGTYRISVAGRRDAVSVRVTLDGMDLGSLSDSEIDLAIPLGTIEDVAVLVGSSLEAANAAPTLPLVRIALRSFTGTAEAHLMAGGYASHLSAPGSKTIGTYDAAVAGGGRTGALSIRGRAAATYTGGEQLTVPTDSLQETGISGTPGVTRDRALRLVLGGTFEGAINRDHKVGVDTHFLLNDRDTFLSSYDVFAPNGQRQRATLLTQLYAEGQASALRYDARIVHRFFSRRDRSEILPAGYTSTDLVGQSVSFSEPVSERGRSDEHALSVNGRVTVKLPLSQELQALVALDQFFITAFENARNFDAALAPLPSLQSNSFATLPTSAQRRTQLTLAAIDHIVPLEWLAFDAGVRFVMASDLGVRASDTPTVLTPTIRVTATPIKGWRLAIGYDSGVRMASAKERYPLPAFEDRGVVGDATARYSVQRLLDLSTSYEGQTNLFRYLAEWRAYWNGARGQPFLSDGMPGVAPVWSFTQDVDTIGSSLSGKVSFGTRSFVHAGFSWHRAMAKVLSRTTLLTDVPQIVAIMSTNIELSRFADLFVSATYYGERRHNVRTLGEQQRAFLIPAGTVVSLALRSQPLFGVRATVVAHNVFDEQRRDDVPRPDRLPDLLPRGGFRLMAGLEYAFAAEAP